MTREIKFRAWDTETKTMLDRDAGYFVEFDGSVWFNCGDGYNDELQSQDGIILMQYTGLKDKNGVEIYEGDIVKWRSIHNKRSTDTHIDAVEFASGYWNLTPWVHELYSCHDDIKVIGNIYENPELL